MLLFVLTNLYTYGRSGQQQQSEKTIFPRFEQLVGKYALVVMNYQGFGKRT